MTRKFTKMMAAVALLTFLAVPMGMWGQTSDVQVLTNANIVAAGEANSGYQSWTITDGNNNEWEAYAIKNKHSNATSSYHYLQIKKYASNTAYYIQVPELGTQITSITMTVSSTSQPMTGGGNSATLYFSSSSSTSSTGTGVASGTGSSSVTIDCSSLNLNTGYITASAGVRIWDVSVTYTTGGSSTDPSITISGDEISNNAVSFDWNSATNNVEYTASVAYNNMDTPTSSDAEVGVYTDATCNTIFTGNYFAASFGEDTQTIEYAFNEDNPSVEPRTVYMRVEVLGDEDYIPCNLITVTQAGKPQYTVTYNGNGATSGTVPTDSNSPYFINSSVTVLGNTGDLAKTGHTFNGWNTAADGSGTSYVAGAQFTITANTTLYAQWILNKHSYTLIVTGTEHLEGVVGIYVSNQQGWVSGGQIEYGQQVTVSVAPVSGYVYTTTVTYGDNVNVPVEQDMFTMPDADVTISVVVEKLDNVTFDFSQIPDFSGWGNGYNSHTVDYQAATVTFEAASKQGQTITDIPVTKGSPVSIVMNDGMPNIIGVTFVCRQWTNKEQTITLHYSTDGGENYTSTEITSNNFTISCAALPTGTNAVKITFSSQSNQVGIESATLNFSTDPVIAVNPTSLTGFAYSEGNGPSESQTFTVSGNYLTSNITLAATNFEMSTDETNWSNSLPLVPTNGTVANTTVYVRLKSGLVENNYNENLNVTSGDLSETVSLSGIVNPAPVLYTYTQATSIVSGKRYIIVNNEASKAMGAQNSNNRAADDVTIQNQTITVSSEDGIYEFVINGPEIITKGEGEQQEQVEVYTIYDVNNSGYLYAASGGNYLRNRSFNEDDNGKWTIQIDDGEATIKAQGTNSRNWMRYNSQSNCFSCYASGQSDIYLYMKDDTNYEFYKDIVGHTTTSGWNFIASPAGTAPTNINALSDLYFYDEDDSYWRNKNVAANAEGFGFSVGTGYLAASSNNITLSFSGASIITAATYQIPLAYSGETNPLAGWNLVGNPYPHRAYANKPYYVIDGMQLNTTAQTTDVPVGFCTGIMVKATSEDEKVTFSKTPANSLPNQLQLTVAQQVMSRGTATSMVNDNAIINFNAGSRLEKFAFNADAAKLYIPQDGKDYAIVSAEGQGEMPVNFRAAKNGTYTLTVNPEGVEMNYLHLIDNMTGANVDLLATPTYTFNASTTDYESRFRLVFSAGTVAEDEAGETFAYFNGGEWVVSNTGQATLQVVDLTGRILSSETVSGNASKAINATPGIYMLRLISADNVKTQKIVVR